MDHQGGTGAAEHQADPLLQFWPEQPQLELQTLAEVMNGPGAGLDWLGPDLGGPQGEAGLPPPVVAPPPSALPHGGGGSSNQLQALLHPQQMPGMQPMPMGLPGGPDAVSGVAVDCPAPACHSAAAAAKPPTAWCPSACMRRPPVACAAAVMASLPPVVRSQFGGGGMAGGGALFAGGGGHGGSDPNLHLHLHQHMGPGGLPAADPSLAGLHAGGLAFPPDLSGHPQQQHHYQQPPLMQQFPHPLAPYASESPHGVLCGWPGVLPGGRPSLCGHGSTGSMAAWQHVLRLVWRLPHMNRLRRPAIPCVPFPGHPSPASPAALHLPACSAQPGGPGTESAPALDARAARPLCDGSEPAGGTRPRHTQGHSQADGRGW